MEKEFFKMVNLFILGLKELASVIPAIGCHFKTVRKNRRVEMPDITLCANDSCPQRHQCYRFMAIRDPLWNTFSDFKPDDKGECDSFFPIGDKRIRKHE